MKHLDSTTEQIRWYLGGAITTNKIHCDANWIDDPASAATPGSTQSESNDTTPVTAVAAPASLQRIVIDMAICNRDTAAATVTVERYDGTDRRDLLTVTLAAGSTLQYVKDSGWSVIKTDGSNPGAGGGGGGDALTTDPLSQFAATTSAQLRGVLSDETGTGVAVFATSPTLVTPLLGTPTSGTLTNCTGLPIAGGGTGASTATGAMDNLDIAAGPWTFSFHSAATTAANSQDFGHGSTASTTVRIKVPAGKTLKILQVIAAIETGATAGTYTIAAILRNVTGATNSDLASGTGTASVLVHLAAKGTIASPLASLAAGNQFGIGWRNDTTSPGALSASQKFVTVIGVFV